MAAIAFAESSFFPFPPDILLVPMLLANRKRAFLLGAWCTLWSVLGGMLGYAIGHILYDSVGQWLISIYHIGSSVDDMRCQFHRNAWMIAIQGMTPFPYKIVAIAAGIAGISFWFFVGLSTFTRGLRFMGEATLFYIFGDQARVFIEKYLKTVLVVVLLLIVAGFVAIKFIFQNHGQACVM
jgi:membrane protein YqaA with SNARE-associated domain